MGILFLSAFLAFGIGQSLSESLIAFERNTGILFVTSNILTFITIGFGLSAEGKCGFLDLYLVGGIS
ncbi:MAG: hypothetical protein IPM42_17270 [Saprospiraceae bacterium]|nr:hypothetical protein [Saprospiraceae bacterium]